MLLQNSISAEVANGLRSLGHFSHDFCNSWSQATTGNMGRVLFVCFIFLAGAGWAGENGRRGVGIIIFLAGAGWGSGERIGDCIFRFVQDSVLFSTKAW